MTLFVGMIGRPARAHHVGHGPAAASCDDPRNGAAGLAVLPATGQCLFQGESQISAKNEPRAASYNSLTRRIDEHE
jgi:hypothetical protein